MNLKLKGVLKAAMPWCSLWLLASAMAQTPAQPEPAADSQSTGSISSPQGAATSNGTIANAPVSANASSATPAARANPVNGENRIPVGPLGSLEARVAACTMCHGATGVQGADAFYPRISGKPAQYLYQQLLRFREGRREYLPMQRLLVNLSDEYLHEIAVWFSKQTPEYETVTPPRASPLILQQGEKLVRHGAADRDIPACVACHGDNLKGMLPGIPGLTGLNNEYITAQMGAWQYGIRHSVDPDCMGDIARKMTSAEVQAVSAWLASQDPRSPGTINESAKTPVTCGIQTVSGVQQ